MNLWLVLGCFAAAVVVDWALVRYQQAIAAHAPWRAGMWSVLCYAVGLAEISAATTVSLWYALPSAVGYFVGSALAARRRV